MFEVKIVNFYKTSDIWCKQQQSWNDFLISFKLVKMPWYVLMQQAVALQEKQL